MRDFPEALGEAILELLNNTGLRRSMDKAAYRKAPRECRFDKQAEAVERFYETMLRLGRWKK